MVVIVRYKRILIAVLFTVLSFVVLSSCSIMDDDTVYALVSTDNFSEGFYYDIYENGDAIITRAQSQQKHLVIPDEIDGHRVVRIGASAFSDNEQMITLKIGDNVTAIGDEAFKNCVKLVTVKLGSSVKSIGAQAFGNCELLCEIEGSNVLETIDHFAFNNCVSLVRMTFPETLKRIGDASFEGCSALCEAILPEGIESVGISAFSNCDTLTKVSLGGLTEISESAFEKCRSITKIEIGKKVKRVGERAFRGCTALSSVTINKSVDIIENSAFAETIWRDTNQDEFLIVGNGILIKYSGNSQNVEIPSEVKRISDAFAGSDTLRSLTAKGVVSVEAGAFSGCKNLARVTFYDGLETIGERAFSSCSSLSTLYLPKSLESVGKNAFYKCTAISEVNYAGSSGNWSSVSVVKNGNETLTAAIKYGVKP